MMGRRMPVRSGDEHDVVSGWRRVLCVFHKAGVAAKTKRRLRRRERREAKYELRAIP